MVICETIAEAIDTLEKNGVTIDFSLGLVGAQPLQPTQPIIPQASDPFEVHRFEGNTEPDDEAAVYVIESQDGRKGILVNGY